MFEKRERDTDTSRRSCVKHKENGNSDGRKGAEGGRTVGDDA